MTSPCGQIRIPINESSDDKSQIEEYLRAYKGEGIQHIALGTTDIYASVEGCAPGVKFLDTPTPTTSCCQAALPDHGEDRAPRAQPHPDRRRAHERAAAADLHRAR
jgi:4-hydroxyphenylpyruvate dioxygenase